MRYGRGWEGEIVLLLSVGGGGGEELLGGAEGTETLSAGGSVLLGAHSFLLLAAGRLEMGSAGLGFPRFLLSRLAEERSSTTNRKEGLLLDGPAQQSIINHIIIVGVKKEMNQMMFVRNW